MKKLSIKKPTKKSTIIIMIVVIVALIGGIVAFNLLKDDNNYYTVWQKIVSNEKGSFRFVIDVRSTPEGEEEQELSESSESVSDLEDMDSADTDSESEDSDEESEDSGDEDVTDDIKTTEDQDKIKKQDSKKGRTWNEIVGEKGTVSDSWSSAEGSSSNGTVPKYKNYQVIIEGTTNSTKPLESVFDISIVTSQFNDRFTTVTIIDDEMWVDLEQMSNWLNSSKDNYFQSIAELIPENAKNMSVDVNKVKIPSMFSTGSESSTGIMETYRKIGTDVNYIIGGIKQSIGKKGLKKSEDVYSLEVSGKQSDKLIGLLESLAKNRSSSYDAVVGNYDLSKEQKQAMLSEKEFFLMATDEWYRNLMVKDLSKANLKISGTARIYDSAQGAGTLEATAQMKYNYDGTDYMISIEGSRVGKGADIKKPGGSATSFRQENLWDIQKKMLNYLNPTSINLDIKTTNDTDTVCDRTLEDFVSLVNNSDKTNSRITKETLPEFLDKYIDYTKTAESTEDDLENHKLAQSFIKSVNGMHSSIGSDLGDVDTSIDQFRTVVEEVGGNTVVAMFNQEESTAKLAVIDLIFLGKSGGSVELEKFSLQTMLSSKYPANNYTVLHDYNNKFDKSLLKNSVSVPANGYANARIYVVMTNGLEYLDLFYGDEKVGDIVAR